MEDWVEDLLNDVHKCRFIFNEEHIKIMKEIVDEVILQKLSHDEIVSLFAEIDAEIVDDLIKMLEDENYITREEGWEIDKKLVKIYDAEFIRDLNNGALKTRLALKTNKNPRPINRFEILGVFFSRTQNSKLLWGKEETNDEILKALVKTHQELSVIRKENAIYEKRKRTIEEILAGILAELNNLKNQTI